MGQSNMAGFGDILAEDRNEIKGVYMLRDSTERYVWRPASHPINARLKSDRYSLAGTFAKAHRDMYPSVKVGLLPMAWGGAPISKMSKGTGFYNELLKKINWSKKYGCIKGILWHQGESDTVNDLLTNSYHDRLKSLIENLRSDLNEPELPFIIGDLAEFYGTGKEHNAPDRVKRIDKVRTALKNMKNELPNIGFVSSKGLKSHDFHQVHFDRASYVLLGYRYFDVYWQTINK